MKNKMLFVYITSVVSALILPVLFLNFLAEPFLLAKNQTLSYIYKQRLRIESAYLAYNGRSPLESYSEADLKLLAEGKAKEYGLHPYLVDALITQESKWNPEAVSFRGAMGLTQVMPEWKNSKLCSSYLSASDIFDPEKNLDCGLKILSHEIKNQGSVKRGLQVYNGGLKCLKNPDCFRATERYAFSILSRVQERLAS